MTFKESVEYYMGLDSVQQFKSKYNEEIDGKTSYTHNGKMDKWEFTKRVMYMTNKIRNNISFKTSVKLPYNWILEGVSLLSIIAESRDIWGFELYKNSDIIEEAAKYFFSLYKEYTPEEEKLILWIAQEYKVFSFLSWSRIKDDYIYKAAKSGVFSSRRELNKALDYLCTFCAAFETAMRYEDIEWSQRYFALEKYNDYMLTLYFKLPPVSVNDLYYRHESDNKELDDKINTHILTLCQDKKIKNRREEIQEEIERFKSSMVIL